MSELIKEDTASCTQFISCSSVSYIH